MNRELNDLRTRHATCSQTIEQLKLVIVSAEEAKCVVERSAEGNEKEIHELKKINGDLERGISAAQLELINLKVSTDAAAQRNASQLHEFEARCTILEHIVSHHNQDMANEEKIVPVSRTELEVLHASKNGDVVMRSSNADADVISRGGLLTNSIQKRSRNSPSPSHNMPKANKKVFRDVGDDTALSLSVCPEFDNDIEMLDFTGPSASFPRPVEMMDISRDSEPLQEIFHSMPLPTIRPPGSLCRSTAPSLTARIARAATLPTRVTANNSHSQSRALAIYKHDTEQHNSSPGTSNYDQRDPSRYSISAISSGPVVSEPRETSPEAQCSTEDEILPDRMARTVMSEIRKINQQLQSIREDLDASKSQFHKSPGRSKGSPNPFKESYSPRPRDPEHNVLMRDLRDTMNPMLEIKHDKDIVYAVTKGHFATLEEAEEGVWNHEIMEKNFIFLKPYWDDLGHEYNKTLADRFTQRFIDKNNCYKHLRSKAEAHFFQRLAQLRKLLSLHIASHDETGHQASRKPKGVTTARVRDNRRRGRQRYGFQRRIDDCNERANEDPSYEPICRTLCILGVDGFSSDETCDEGFIVRKKLWRRRKLEKKVIKNAIRARPTCNINGNNLPGGKPRTRIYHPYPPISTRPAPIGQPINHYEPSWYNAQSSATRKLLQAKPPVPFPGEDSSDSDSDCA